MLRTLKILLILFFYSFTMSSQGQDEYVVADSVVFELDEKQCNGFASIAAKKCDKLASKVRKTTYAALSKFQKAEDKLLNSICGINERHAESLLRTSLYSFRRMEEQIQRKSNEPLKSYLPELDSLSIVTKYLEQFPPQIPMKNEGIKMQPDSEDTKCNCNGLAQLRTSQENLNKELKRAETVSAYIKERTAYLDKIAGKYPQLQAMMPSLHKIDYYLGAQTREYFSLFADRSNPEKLLMSALKKAPGFGDFANVEGALAGLNSSPASSGSGQSMEEAMAQITEAAKAQGKDVQSVLNSSNLWKDGQEKIREEVGQEHAIINDVTTSVENGVQMIETAADSLNRIADSKKDSLYADDNKSKKKDWKPNPLKTKRFIDRLSYGANLQANPHTTFFPTSGVLAAQLSYQITTKMNLGFGASYLVGFQKPSSAPEGQRISFMSSNGFNLRGYYDYNIYRRFFLQTNFEQNYRKLALTHTSDIALSRELINNTSLLAGLKLKTPSTKTTQKTMEILYDFLHERTGQPGLVVRVGVEFLPRHGVRK
jgi:hypothetical protein